MAAFDLIKRLMSGAGAAERRHDERFRAPTGLRVLVVDDSATIRAVLGKMLLQDGYAVLKAANGDEALAMARSELPGLIFLDIVLPGISGFAVLRALRRDPLTQSIPIVMISGNLQATEQFYVQRFGADDFMKKPFGRAEVFDRIRSLVNADRLPRRVEEASPTGIPHDVSAEEWNAIPDVALPDAGPAHPVHIPELERPADAVAPITPLALDAVAASLAAALPSRADPGEPDLIAEPSADPDNATRNVSVSVAAATAMAVASDFTLAATPESVDSPDPGPATATAPGQAPAAAARSGNPPSASNPAAVTPAKIGSPDDDEADQGLFWP